MTTSTSSPNKQYTDALWQNVYLSVKEELSLLEQYLTAAVQEDVPFVQFIGEHLLKAGGKRIRPLLLFLTARLGGYKGENLLPLASALELIHTATLLHDDVVDESPTRRGFPSAHVLWGNKASILTGDYLFSKAFTSMVQANSLEVMHILAQASQRIAKGELLELKELGSLNLSLESYLKIIEEKTAALFQAACEIGALLSQAPDQEKKLLSTYGTLFGLLFQIKDDLMDYMGDSQKTGKIIGSDFREKKMTLPAILAYQNSTEEEKNFWEEAFSKKKQPKNSLSKAIKLIQKYNIPSLIQKYMEKYQEEALESLSYFPPSKEKDLLINLIYYASIRLS